MPCIRPKLTDAASSGSSSLVLHRWLATPQSASAHDRAIVSALLGGRPRHASDHRRPRHAAPRRPHRVQARPTPKSMRRLPQQARQREQCPAIPGSRGWHPFRPAPSVERRLLGSASPLCLGSGHARANASTSAKCQLRTPAPRCSKRA